MSLLFSLIIYFFSFLFPLRDSPRVRESGLTVNHEVPARADITTYVNARGYLVRARIGVDGLAVRDVVNQ